MGVMSAYTCVPQACSTLEDWRMMQIPQQLQLKEILSQHVNDGNWTPGLLAKG